MEEMTKMQISEQIYALLEAEFLPDKLVVVNESHYHAGHAEAGDGGDTHFKVQISAMSLRGKNKIAQHRAIYACLSELINNPIHALAIEVG